MDTNPVTPLATVFKTAAFNHSATSPRLYYRYNRVLASLAKQPKSANIRLITSQIRHSERGSCPGICVGEIRRTNIRCGAWALCRDGDYKVNERNDLRPFQRHVSFDSIVSPCPGYRALPGGYSRRIHADVLVRGKLDFPIISRRHVACCICM